MYKEKNLVGIDYNIVQKFFCFCLCFIDSFSAKLEPMTGKTADLCLMLPQWLMPWGLTTNVSKLIWEFVGGVKKHGCGSGPWVFLCVHPFSMIGTREYWMINQRTRLSPRRKIWLLPSPLLSASCLSFSVFLYIAVFAGRSYWRERVVGEEPDHTTARKPGPL